MQFLILEAQPDHAEAMVSILNPIIEAGIYTSLDTTFSVDDERKFITDFPERGILHVAVHPQDKNVVGFQSLEPFARYTHAFDHVGVIGTFVDLSHRRKGIASSLFSATFAVARQKGYEKLFTYIRADNSAAMSTYLHHGFYKIGTAKKHAKIGGRYVDEIIVERFL